MRVYFLINAKYLELKSEAVNDSSLLQLGWMHLRCNNITRNKTPGSIPCTLITSNSPGLVNIVLARSFIFADEVRSRIPSKPICHLWKFLPKTIDRLKIHVGLCNEFWKSNWKRLDASQIIRGRPTKKPAQMFCTIRITCGLSSPFWFTRSP